MNTVRNFKFPMLIPCIQVFEVFIESVIVRFLDRPAGRSIVTGNRKPHSRSVSKGNRFLHESLAEGTSSYYCPSVIILDCTGKYLTGRCTEFIDQNNQVSRFKFHLPRSSCFVPAL